MKKIFKITAILSLFMASLNSYGDYLVCKDGLNNIAYIFICCESNSDILLQPGYNWFTYGGGLTPVCKNDPPYIRTVATCRDKQVKSLSVDNVWSDLNNFQFKHYLKCEITP